MADKLTDEIKLLFRTSIQDKDIKEVSKNIKSALENAVITFDEAEIKKEIVPVIQMLQKLFAKAEMKFDAEKLFAMPSREALQKIANISVDKFQAAFDRALEKSGGVKIDFGDFDFSSLTTSLGRVEKDLERVSNKIANTTKKSVSDIEESIKRLNKIETKTINSKKPADGSTETVKTKETVQTNKLDTTVGSIEKLFSDIDSGNKTNATQIKNAYKKYIKTIENNDPWEIQYQAIVEYVAKFESLSAKTKGKLKELPDFQKLYDSLSPKAGAARESLHNLVSTARGGELAEYKNQPWAREKTLERVARTLENGISVKEDGGSSNGNSNSTPNKDDEENTRIRNQRRLELSSQLEQLGDEPEDLNTLEQGLAKRKEIFELLKKEDLLTDEIQASYDSSNKDIEAKIKLLRKAAKEDEKITQSIKERQYEAYRAVESPEKSGKSKKDAIDDYGAEYWASTKEGAESYANNQFGLSSIISAQIKPVNPLVIDAQEAIWNDWENIPGLKDLFPGLLDVVQESGYDDEIQKYINEQAKLAGFDSVIFKNVQDNFDADLDDDAPIMDTIAVLDDRIVSLTGSFTELESRTENGDKMFSETMSKVPEYYVPSDNTGSESYLSELREKQTKSQEWYDDTISRLEDELEKRQEELSAAKQKLSENPKSYTAKETVKEASYAVKDTEKLIETLNKNKVISQKAIQIEIDGLAKVSDISDEVAADIQAETTAHQQNTEAIKQEVAAEKELNDVKTQVVDTDDDAETIAKENGALADKLELLRDIAEQYGNNITQKTRNRYEELNQKDMNDGLTEKEEERFSELGDQIIEADEALEEFEKTYDKIILKLANGKKVEILPDDKGLRSLYNFADGYGEEYNGVEIDDVIYQRVQKEAVTHQENAAAIVAETQAQEQLNENLKEKEVIENSDNNEELSDIKAETDAINQQNEALKENIDLKAKANTQNDNIVVGADVEPDTAKPSSSSTEVKASIDTEELRSLLNSITYNVKVIQDAESAEGNKVSINADELRSVLDSITYNVKIAHSDTDKESNKIAIDESALETILKRITYDVKIAHDDNDKESNKIAIDESALEQTLNRVFGNILAPKDDGKKSEGKKEPWALEKTLNTTIKGILDQIQTNTAKVDAPSDTTGTSEFTTKLAEIKSILESINAKIMKGGVIATRDAVKQAGAQAVEPEVKRQAARSNMMKSIINDYKTMGKLAAQFASDGNLETKAMLENLKEEIRRKRASLSITMDENANLREKYSIAFEAEKRLLEAEEQQRKINEQNKSDAKAEKKRLADAKKLAQREAMVGKAGNAVGRAENTWMTAEGMEDALPKDFDAKLDDYYQKLDALRKKQAELKNSDIISEEDKADLLAQTNNVNKLTEEIGGLIAEYQRLSGDNVDSTTIRTNTIQPGANMDTYEQQLKNYVREITNGKGQIKGFNAETKTLTYTVKTGAHEFTTYTAAVRHLDDSLVSVRGATKKTETFLEATARKMKEISSYMSGMALISRAGQELRRGIQYVREIDLALTELKKVTDETEESYDKFLETAAKTADKVGSTIQKVVSSTADWARLGYSMEQAAKFAETTQILMNVSEFTDVSQATDTLISSVQAFGYTAETSMEVVDLLNTIGKQYCRGYIVIYNQADNYNGQKLGIVQTVERLCYKQYKMIKGR